MRVTSAGPTIVQPVAALISALPPAWSGCQWVLKMKSRPQPAAFSSFRIAAGVRRVDAGGLAGGVVADEEAIVVGKAGELADGEGHGCLLP